MSSRSRAVSSYRSMQTPPLFRQEKASDMMQKVCPLRVCGLAPVAACQSRTVVSFDADATILLLSEKATNMIQPVPRSLNIGKIYSH
jgi:hypothetical protein